MPTPSNLSQILRFLIAGALGVSLYYLILYVLTDLVGVWYVASATVAGIANYTSNFLFQKFWTFKNKDAANIHRQAFKYLVLMILLFINNLALLYALVEWANLWYLKAQIIVTVIVTVISYLVSRRIFANKPCDQTSTGFFYAKLTILISPPCFISVPTIFPPKAGEARCGANKRKFFFIR
jgi:putative flippase GtrA